MSATDGAAFLRGLRMQELGRHEDAMAFFREAIAHQADNAEAHARLALCQLEVEGLNKEALRTIETAVGLDPENAWFHAIKALILGRLNRDREAIEAAKAAVGLDPDDPFSHAVLAQSLMGRQRWAEAEEAARRALALDGDHTYAQNLLAMVLRLQGKLDENSVAVDHLLAERPEDEMSHLNAGYAALHRLDHRQAEAHFREALRLDPEFEAARDGLIESFRARSAFYRLYLRYTFFMQRFTEGNQWLIIIGVYLAYRFGRSLLGAVHPVLGGLLVVVYLLFVLWVWLARGFGNFLIWCDRSARMALHRSEKSEALFVGGAFVAALILILSGAIFSMMPLLIAGAALLIGTIPASLVFTNRSRKGRILFGAILTYIYVVGILTAVLALGQPAGSQVMETAYALCGAGVLAALLSTWLGNVPSLRRE